MAQLGPWGYLAPLHGNNGVCVCAVWVCLFAHRWNELQCSPVSSGNFTPSGRIVKVSSGHKFDQKEAFSFVVGHVKMCRLFFVFFVCVSCVVSVIYWR